MDAKSRQGNAACLRMIAESQAVLGGWGGGGGIHNAEIPRGSTCLLTQARTHTFSFPGARTHTCTHTHACTHTHTQLAGPEEAVAAVV